MVYKNTAHVVVDKRQPSISNHTFKSKQDQQTTFSSKKPPSRVNNRIVNPEPNPNNQYYQEIPIKSPVRFQKVAINPKTVNQMSTATHHNPVIIESNVANNEYYRTYNNQNEAQFHPTEVQRQRERMATAHPHMQYGV